MLLALLLSAGGLLVLLAVFLLTTEIHPQSAGDSPQVSSDSSSATAVAAAPPPAGTLEADGAPTAAAPAPVRLTGSPASTATANDSARGPAAASIATQQAASPLLGASPIVLSGPEPSVPFDVASRTDNPPFSNRDAFVDWMVKHTDQKAKYLKQKWDRAEIIQRLGNFTHDRVREAFLRTPREYFSRDTRRAYENAVLPIGYGQTISGPHLVSRMTDYLDPQPEQKVLEIGTGSGYQSALLSEISNHVYTIEIVEKLARETNAIYERLEPQYPEYRNVKRKVDDGYYGWEEYAPFDRIIVTCGIDHVPPALIKQLAPGGIMVIPIGPPSGQTILRIVKKVAPDGTVSLEREDIYHGKKKQIFVPFTARGGGVHKADDQN
jgi:protein-L-isoaspartate(D-aspartate) O-methyltransferase